MVCFGRMQEQLVQADIRSESGSLKQDGGIRGEDGLLGSSCAQRAAYSPVGLAVNTSTSPFFDLLLIS